MNNGFRLIVVLFIISLAIANTGVTSVKETERSSNLRFDDSSIVTSTVWYVSGTDTVSAYLAVPKGERKFPALIVIHEWWGLTPWMKSNADSFAKKGYAALAIDLYRGKSTSDPKEAMDLVKNFSKERAIIDLKAAYNYLSGLSNVNTQKIGSIGWCFGGGYSFQAALNIPQLTLCIVNYGTLSSDKSIIKNIHCPMLCIFGDEDKAILPDSVKAFDKAAKDIGLNADVRFFPGVGHAFMNPGNKNGYKKETADLAWEDIFNFLDKNLKN
jgi:carboxymethylenebutenolidase